MHSWAMVRRVALGSAVSDACTIGGDLFMTLLCFLFFKYLSTDVVLDVSYVCPNWCCYVDGFRIPSPLLS